MEKVIFWGAGATAALGIKVTSQQSQFIQNLVGTNTTDKLPPLQERIEQALGFDIGRGPLGVALKDLITVLGDRPDNYENIDAINTDEIQAMRRSWKGDDKTIRSRIYISAFYMTGLH